MCVSEFLERFINTIASLGTVDFFKKNYQFNLVFLWKILLEHRKFVCSVSQFCSQGSYE